MCNGCVRSQREGAAGAGGEWYDLAHRSALAHRRVLGQWAGQQQQQQQKQQQQQGKQQQLMTCNGARRLCDLHVDDRYDDDDDDDDDNSAAAADGSNLTLLLAATLCFTRAGYFKVPHRV